jgi:putative cell wall-binding protein
LGKNTYERTSWYQCSQKIYNKTLDDEWANTTVFKVFFAIMIKLSKTARSSSPPPDEGKK